MGKHLQAGGSLVSGKYRIKQKESANMKSSHQGWLKEYYDIHRGDPVAAWAFHIHEVGVWVLKKVWLIF